MAEGFVRRVVTGHDKDGKSIVLCDGLTPTLKTNPLRPGHHSTEVWLTRATPAPISASEPDPTLPGPGPIHPAPRGTSHSWANRADQPCKILFVLIDGEFDPALRQQF